MIELKINKNAIDKIFNKKYTDKLKDYQGVKLAIGISYDTKTKDYIMKQIYILFPETLYGDTADGYKKASLWLCNRYSLLCYNMRDVFSAGGKLTTINGEKIPKPYPAVVKRLLKYRYF